MLLSLVDQGEGTIGRSDRSESERNPCMWHGYHFFKPLLFAVVVSFSSTQFGVDNHFKNSY